MKTKETYYHRDEQSQVWIGKDQDWVVVAKMKVEGGVKQMIQRFDFPPSANQCREWALKHGNFSPRPYQLAQACDGTIDTCVHALLMQFCEVHSISYTDLYKRAYPDEKQPTAEENEDTIAVAEWEGVQYPEAWGDEEFKGLLQSLHNVNNHSLAGELEDVHQMQIA